jgi:hypothetical protein
LAWEDLSKTWLLCRLWHSATAVKIRIWLARLTPGEQRLCLYVFRIKVSFSICDVMSSSSLNGSDTLNQYLTSPGPPSSPSQKRC